MIFPVNQKGKDAASRVGLGRLLSLCSLCLSLLVSLLLPTVTCLFRRPGAKSVYQNFAWPLRIGSYRRIPGRFQLSYKFLSSSVKKNISSNRSVTARVFAAEEQIRCFVLVQRAVIFVLFALSTSTSTFLCHFKSYVLNQTCVFLHKELHEHDFPTHQHQRSLNCTP